MKTDQYKNPLIIGDEVVAIVDVQLYRFLIRGFTPFGYPLVQKWCEASKLYKGAKITLKTKKLIKIGSIRNSTVRLNRKALVRGFRYRKSLSRQRILRFDYLKR